MYICYLDESGTTEAGDSSRHFVLVGLAILATAWKNKDTQVDAIKKRYGLESEEVHTAWMLREFPEQKVISNFEGSDYATRRRFVVAQRTQNLARHRSNKQGKAIALNYRKTAAYIHLTKAERLACVQELADLIGSWADARLFAEAQQKKSLPSGAGDFEEAFEQVVTRFNRCLGNIGGIHGILVQDNNETMAKRLTRQMRKFHREGTTWAKDIEFVVETPMFVDSELTSMVQLADLCAYAIRRFFDHGEDDLLNRIYPIFDRNLSRLVGIRHYTRSDKCDCKVCVEHGRKQSVA
ncbi:MAG: DUF3800 domain-containing protein [Rhodanobacter thiooxydans]|nr:DUF3800 domain-containing protein [Rhodanobacter thiooxydans]